MIDKNSWFVENKLVGNNKTKTDFYNCIQEKNLRALVPNEIVSRV